MQGRQLTMTLHNLYMSLLFFNTDDTIEADVSLISRLLKVMWELPGRVP